MAKVTAGLLSLDARGTIGKTVTFSNWRGQPYARQRVVPANPQTTAQQANRTLFSTLREMWKLAPTGLRAPWTLFAQGRKFTDSNKYVGENIRTLGGQSDMNAFIASPGAKGGLAATSVSAATGSSSGEIDVTLVAPTLPTGWAITNAWAVAFPDQDPTVGFGGPIAIDSDATDPYVITLTGLGSAVACQACGWFEFTKDDGSTCYGPSITDQATSGA